MNTELTNEAIDILSIILASIMVATMILYLIYLCISYVKTKNARKDYVKTLKEHDKSVIKDYEDLEWTPRKKNKK